LISGKREVFVMSRYTILFGSIVALGVAGPAFAQSSQPHPPKGVSEAPALGGEPQTKPGPKVINIASNEASLARLANTKVVHVTRQQLGDLSPVLFQQSQNKTAPVPQNLATVKTVLLDPGKHAATFIAVETDDHGGPLLVPWSEVKPFNEPNPVVATALSQEAVAGAPPLTQQQGKTIDVEQALLGRPVRTADDKEVGTLDDVIAEIGSGKVDYLVVRQDGIGFGTKNAAHAVPWAAVKPPSADKSQPIALTLDEQHWRTTPVFGGSKAQETQGMHNKARETGASGPIP
jgi:sporulation protein YlmC with PRC-barrel domain